MGSIDFNGLEAFFFVCLTDDRPCIRRFTYTSAVKIKHILRTGYVHLASEGLYQPLDSQSTNRLKIGVLNDRVGGAMWVIEYRQQVLAIPWH